MSEVMEIWRSEFEGIIPQIQAILVSEEVLEVGDRVWKEWKEWLQRIRQRIKKIGNDGE